MDGIYSTYDLVEGVGYMVGLCLHLRPWSIVRCICYIFGICIALIFQNSVSLFTYIGVHSLMGFVQTLSPYIRCESWRNNTRLPLCLPVFAVTARNICQ